MKKEANIARLKVYVKRASEDDMQTSSPAVKKSEVHHIYDSFEH